MCRLARITIYPIKSLDGCSVPAARVLPSGALEHDRRWAIVDAQSRPVIGKRTAAIHRLRAIYDESLERVTLTVGATSQTFDLTREASSAATFLSELFGLKCRLIENAGGGFPDDTDAAGPTLISTASLSTTAAWFEGVDLEEMRRRIRANLEVDAAEPFWEDRLVNPEATPRGFSLGPVIYRGRRICQRCIVPTRDSQTGEGDPNFSRRFNELRRTQLPAWSLADEFDHFYRLAINTSSDWLEPNAVLRVGDQLSIRQRPSAAGR